MEKAQQVSESFALAVLLTLSGGFMDAYSYIGREHVFANAQTGNILLLGIHLATGNWAAALRYLFPVLAFACGIFVAEMIHYRFQNRKHLHWRQVTILAETLILLGVAFISQNLNLLANSLTSFACGAQVESFRKVNGSGVATTMCIGNLRSATQAVCDYRYTKNQTAKENGFLYFSIIGIFVVGAIGGHFGVRVWREKAIIVSAVLLLAGFVLMLKNHEP
jgi:uncharacterized membrane protein YoaK (UPF0700 family)